MEIVPQNASLFRAAMDGLKEFMPQVQLQITSDGVRVSGMDVSHVGFLDYRLSATDCESLRVPAPQHIGIYSATLSRTLAPISSGDRVTLSTDKSNEKLIVSYTNDKINKRVVYEMNTLDIMDETHELPDLSYPASVVLKTADFASVVKEVSAFGDAIALKLDEHGFHVSSKGDSGHVTQTLENTEDRAMELSEDSVEAAFGAKYLLNIMKAGAPLTSTMKIEFDTAQPMRATFEFGNGSHLIVYLAPKIADD